LSYDQFGHGSLKLCLVERFYNVWPTCYLLGHMKVSQQDVF
jgi:hypothetical protein